MCDVNGMQHNLPLVLVFFISFEPVKSTDKISHGLHSLEVKIRPNCHGRSWNPPTQRPMRQLHL